MTILRCGGFPAWRVVVGILHNFLHLRVRENVFEKNPQQPTTGAKPTTLFLRGAIPGTWLRTLGGGLKDGTIPLVSVVLLA